MFPKYQGGAQSNAGARQTKRKSNYYNYNSISAMLTAREASRLLFVDENTLRCWTNQGKIKAYNLGRRGDCRYKREDALRYFAKISIAKRMQMFADLNEAVSKGYSFFLVFALTSFS
jgi:hypothetical protein